MHGWSLWIACPPNTPNTLSFPPPLSLISLSYPIHFSVAIAKNQIFASIIERERRESRKCVGCFFIVTKNERIRQTWISSFYFMKTFFRGMSGTFFTLSCFHGIFFHQSFVPFSTFDALPFLCLENEITSEMVFWGLRPPQSPFTFRNVPSLCIFFSSFCTQVVLLNFCCTLRSGHPYVKKPLFSSYRYKSHDRAREKRPLSLSAGVSRLSAENGSEGREERKRKQRRERDKIRGVVK